MKELSFDESQFPFNQIKCVCVCVYNPVIQGRDPFQICFSSIQAGGQAIHSSAYPTKRLLLNADAVKDASLCTCKFPRVPFSECMRNMYIAVVCMCDMYIAVADKCEAVTKPSTSLRGCLQVCSSTGILSKGRA